MQEPQKEIIPYKYPIVFISEQRKSNSLCFAAHWHNRLEILLILEGALELSLPDKSYIANAGEIVLIHPRQLHEGYSLDNPIKYYVVSVDIYALINNNQFFHGISNLLQSYLLNSPSVIQDETIRSLIMNIAEEKEKNDNSSETIIVGDVYVLLGYLVRNYISSTSNQIGDAKFINVLEYIDEHFTETISTAELAQRFSYEKTYFCRKFRQQMGYTISEYVNLIRLETACGLLVSTNNQIVNIAQSVGFEDANYFTRQFRLYYGMSPSEFRSKQQ